MLTFLQNWQWCHSMMYDTNPPHTHTFRHTHRCWHGGMVVCPVMYSWLPPAAACFSAALFWQDTWLNVQQRKKPKTITAPPGSTEVLRRVLKIATGVPWKQRGRECVSVHHQHIFVTVSVCRFSMWLLGLRLCVCVCVCVCSHVFTVCVCAPKLRRVNCGWKVEKKVQHCNSGPDPGLFLEVHSQDVPSSLI